MDEQKVDLRTVRLSVRTFNPNSPLYNQPSKKVLISDISPPRAVSSSQPHVAPIRQDVMLKPTPRPMPAVSDDIDPYLPPMEHAPREHQQVHKTHKKTKKRSSYLWSGAIILLTDVAILAASFFNKARYHHIYIAVLILNLLLALGIFAKPKIVKWTIFSYQIVVLIVTIGIVALFTYNFINTNNIYHSNYQEIKNQSSSMSFQQKQDLASYQDTTIFNRNAYISQSKIFYGLMAAQLIQSITVGILLIKRD